MNGFQRHGIAHLSPSSLNVWMAQPALWVMERLLKKRGDVGCAAHRGTASEAGVVKGLLDPKMDIAECQAHALLEYDRLTALSGDTRRAKEREAIPGIVATAIEELRQYGPLTQTQGRVEHCFDGLSVPIMGFFDFMFADCSILVDLKTTLRLPSEPSNQHCRQCALYVHNTNAAARLAYTTPQKIGVYEVLEPARHLADLVNIAQRLERFLSISNDPMELAGFLTPDTDSFWFKDPTARAYAREVFGL